MHERSRYDPDIHDRRSIRVANYDYRRRGSYFITIDTHGARHRFGEVRPDGNVALSTEGEIIRRVWRALPERYPYVRLGEDIVMPNHLHGIIDIDSDGSRIEERASLSAIVGCFKSLADRAIRDAHPVAGKIWQRNFYERIIRDAQARETIECYIRANPQRWLERGRR